MAEALVTGILEKIGSTIGGELIYPELWLVLGKGEVVQKLQDNLKTIQAVLNDAEKREVKEELVKLWLAKLKDAAYNVDNVLDEMDTAMIKSKIEEEEEKTATTSAKVCSCLSWIFIELNKLVQRCGMAHKIRNLNGRIDEITKEREKYGFELTRSRDTEVHERPTTKSFVDVSDILGRKKYRDDLVSKLLGEGSEGERSSYVISLVGMGGIGKTTLAQLAYNDDKVKDHFMIRMWVCVSEPYDEIRVAKVIIESIEGQSPNISEPQNLLKKIGDLIGEKKFFLVLDDVWTDDYRNWEPFRIVLKSGAQGSRILITTRKESVAKMVDSADTINLKELSSEECWLICSKMALVEKDDKQLEYLGRELANKCKGLPLAAKTLGSLMRKKRSEREWKNILLSNLWELEDVHKGLLGPLLLSFHELSSAIKQCFLYCAVFPKDYLFSKNELVYLWMAEGYLHSKPNFEMEIIGEEYFEKLVMHSFFQDFEKDDDDDKIIRCKMHDIVHDFAQSMTTNECFTIDSAKELRIDGKSAHHINLTLMEEAQFPASIYNAKNLRTLFYKSRGIVPLNFFQHLACLRTLTLIGNSFEILPNEVEKLIYLRFLKIFRNWKIRELPETICNLCNLQTLDVSRCGLLKNLPRKMGKLINLRHLILDDVSIKSFPKGIGKLSSLRTLKKYRIGGTNDSEGCKLGELKNLNHLKGYLSIEGLGNVIDVQEAKNAELKKKIHLRHLELDFDLEIEENRRVENDEFVVNALKPHPELEIEENRRVENDELVVNALEPHPELEMLYIYWYKGTMYPNWITYLTKLKRLRLWDCHKLERLPPLGKLPFLESLMIWNANSLKKVGVEFVGIESNNKKDKGSTSSLVLFPKLKSLTFNSLFEWEEWDGIGGRREEGGGVTIMPCLENLTILYCPKLKAPPNFLETTPLQKLTIDCRISNWMTLATSPGLKQICLQQCIDEEHLSFLVKLPFLESLTIEYSNSLKKVGVEFLGIEPNNNKKEEGSTSSSLILFPNLKSLDFGYLTEWEEWDREEEGGCVTIMPRLQELSIRRCPKLKSLPDFLPTTQLKRLEISYCSILSQRYKRETGEDWPKISQIPDIQIYDF
jgi:hypothetical protein